MKSVYFENRLPNGFEERFFFSAEMPYTINIKHFQAEDIVPLHYAETLELLLCDGLRGDIFIGGQHFPLQGRQLFVAPPYTIHSNAIRSGPGMMYVFKVSLREFARYVHLDNYLAACGCQMSQLLYHYPADYDAVRETVLSLIENDGELSRCIPLVLEIFYILSRHVDRERDASSLDLKFRDSSLQELITWTQQNYAHRISIEEVARLTGYSKFYFCSRFKSLTGLTYLNYLNGVRVSHACLMLARGDSVQTVCRAAGFESVSHFIQVFKKIQHMTPHQYACGQKKLSADDGQNSPPPS